MAKASIFYDQGDQEDQSDQWPCLTRLFFQRIIDSAFCSVVGSDPIWSESAFRGKKDKMGEEGIGSNDIMIKEKKRTE